MPESMLNKAAAKRHWNTRLVTVKTLNSFSHSIHKSLQT